MTMKLYNTLSRKIEALNHKKDSVIGIYSCGPTVYDNLHIGNLSSFVYADLLRRTLSMFTTTKHVMNITDVDDKTIRRARTDYPDLAPNLGLSKVTNKYTEVFLNDMDKIGNDIKSLTIISAIDSINDMVELIQKIINNGCAYLADDGVYFSIDSYIKKGNEYGLFQEVDTSKAKARILNDEYDKDNASDFALWKSAKVNEPCWDAYFEIENSKIYMPGRPGWHIECSAMSSKLLGAPFDIHTGGIDLRFPHHENEIAQTKSANNVSLANIFFHNAHILVEGRKMSKSLGNVITLREIESNSITPMAFRIFILESHYRNESNFSWNILEAAQHRYNHWQSVIDRAWQVSIKNTSVSNQNIVEEFTESRTKILKHLQNDLDTPAVLREIDQALNKLDGVEVDTILSEELNNYFDFIDQALGIVFDRQDISDAQKQLIYEREIARDNKDFTKSDTIRNELLEQGIAIRDTASGTVWQHLKAKS